MLIVHSFYNPLFLGNYSIQVCLALIRTPSQDARRNTRSFFPKNSDQDWLSKNSASFSEILHNFPDPWTRCSEKQIQPYNVIIASRHRVKEDRSTEGRSGLVDSSSRGGNLVGIFVNNNISISGGNIAALVMFNICTSLCLQHL